MKLIVFYYTRKLFDLNSIRIQAKAKANKCFDKQLVSTAVSETLGFFPRQLSGETVKC